MASARCPSRYGIPVPAVPNYTSGFLALPVSQGTNALWPNFRRGYIESWNLFVQRDLGMGFVVNVGYVGDLFVRQQTNVSPYNAAPLPSASTPCMANGQWNTAPYRLDRRLHRQWTARNQHQPNHQLE